MIMAQPPDTLEIGHLCHTPEHTAAVAAMIYREFWVGVKDGLTEDFLNEHLRGTSTERIPLSLVALVDGQPVGTVNLIDNDDEKRAHLHPWLAAMVVLEPWRGRGIGTRLVQALLVEAQRLGLERLYFGTDGPGFYSRLGATLHEQVTPTFCIMQFPLAGTDAGTVPPSAT
jgi:predicted N-acetyltransferase YhbS